MAKKAAKAPKKKAAKKAAAKKKAPAKKAAAKKKAPAKKAAAKKAAAKKAAAKKAPAKKAAKRARAARPTPKEEEDPLPPIPKRPKPGKPHKLTSFEKQQKQKLLDLRDSLVDAMTGVAKDNLKGADGGDSSAFGMHQADAGSDAYDRDFALNLLSQEQDALYEIEEALKRVDLGVYGVCEMSGKKIVNARLEAIPFTRYTVECQAQIERETGSRGVRRPPQRSMFGLMDEAHTEPKASKDED